MGRIYRDDKGKVCSRCKSYKPYDDFYADKNRKDGRDYWCSKCARRAHKPDDLERRKQLWREKPKNHPSKLRKYEWTKRNYYKYKHGLTQEDYGGMLLSQNYACAVCSTDLQKTKAVVDHCHETGKVRGILCGHCNTMLGYAKNNPEILNSAAEYLRAAT